MNTRERSESCDEFNRRGSPYDVLATSSTIASCGLNLHHDCCRGLMLQFPWNANIGIQTFYRLIRMGQKSVVEWRIIKTRGTYYDLQEMRLCEKWAPMLLAEAALPDWLPNMIKELVVYEHMKVYFKQTFNRYTWRVSTPGFAQEYNARRHKAMGDFFSAAARVFVNLKAPDEDASDQEREAFHARVNAIGPKLGSLAKY